MRIVTMVSTVLLLGIVTLGCRSINPGPHSYWIGSVKADCAALYDPTTNLAWHCGHPPPRAGAGHACGPSSDETAQLQAELLALSSKPGAPSTTGDAMRTRIIEQALSGPRFCPSPDVFCGYPVDCKLNTAGVVNVGAKP